MSVKLLTEHNLEFLSFKGGYTGSSVSRFVKCRIVGNHMSRLKFSTNALDISKQCQTAECSTYLVSDLSHSTKI